MFWHSRLPRQQPPCSGVSHNRQLLWVMRFASAVGLGAMGGFIFSLKQVNPVVHLELTLGSGIAFLASAALGWWIWNWIAEPGSRAAKRLAIASSTVLVIGTLGGFIYALKDVRYQRMREVAAGVLLAFLALGVVAVVMVFVTQFLEQDERRNALPPKDPGSE